MKVLHYFIKQRKGHYVHAIEVTDSDTIDNIVCQIWRELRGTFTKDDLLEFFETIEVHYLPYEGEQENEQDEKEVYGYDFKEMISQLEYNYCNGY